MLESISTTQWGRIVWWGKLSVTLICLIAMWRLLPKVSAPLEFFWIHPWYVVAAALLRPLFTLVMAARTFILLSGVVPDLRPGTVVRATYIGQMANLVLPSGAGGDLVRGAIFCRKSHYPWLHIVTLLVIDRLLGTVSLLSYVFVISSPLLFRIFSPAWLETGAALIVVLLTAVWFSRGLVLQRLQQSSLWRDTATALKQMPRVHWFRAGSPCSVIPS